jgi:hypothetical protein
LVAVVEVAAGVGRLAEEIADSAVAAEISAAEALAQVGNANANERISQ